MNERCEPPPEWRDRDGWHWMKKGGSKLPAYWTPRDEWWDAVHFSGDARTVAAMGFSVTAPVTPPAVVAALVEALDAVLALPVGQEQLRHLDGGIGTATPNAAWLRARAALALYREAKR